MPLRPITEQQFRTRRKDRRMVWVDAVAVLVGMVMLLATVGGVVFVEPEPTPVDWDYSFFEATTKHKHCAAITTLQEGCTQLVALTRPDEGETIETIFDPIDWPNVTSVRFTLTWVDDIPIPDDERETYTYDEDSTDELLLTVTPPNGVPMSINGSNDVNTQFGSLGLVWEFLVLPEPGSVRGFTEKEAMEQVVPRFTDESHTAYGEWKAEVTLVRKGNQEGTIPINPCRSAFETGGQPAPDDLPEECETEDQRRTIEASPFGDYAPSGAYTYSYEDKGQSWVLQMAIRAYDSQVNIG